jgi:hypothetical protein
MRAISVALIVALLTVTNVFGQEPGAWRKVAEAIPLGSKIKIQRTDGRRVSGTLIRADDQGVTVKKSARLPEAPVTVSYEAVANMERDSGGMHWGKAIGFGAAAGAAAILTIFVIALQLD